MRLIVHLRTGTKGSPATVMAAGIIVESLDPHEVHYAAGHFLGALPRGKAEAAALLRAVEIAKQLGPEEVAILADSEGLVKRITGEIFEADPDLADVIQEVQAALLSLDLWTIRHLPKDDIGKSERLVRAALDAQKNVVVVDEINPTNAVGFDSLKPDPSAFDRAAEAPTKKRLTIDDESVDAENADDPRAEIKKVEIKKADNKEAESKEPGGRKAAFDKVGVGGVDGDPSSLGAAAAAARPKPAVNTGQMNLARFRVTLEGSGGCVLANADGVCYQFGPTTPPGLCLYAAQAAFAVDPLHWRSPNHRRIITSCAKCKAGVSVEPG